MPLVSPARCGLSVNIRKCLLTCLLHALHKSHLQGIGIHCARQLVPHANVLWLEGRGDTRVLDHQVQVPGLRAQHFWAHLKSLPTAKVMSSSPTLKELG